MVTTKRLSCSFIALTVECFTLAGLNQKVGAFKKKSERKLKFFVDRLLFSDKVIDVRSVLYKFPLRRKSP